jgi:Kef-type K+ transport system membrane component KefB
VLLLPLFFAFTGLRTEIGLLNHASAWFVCLGIIVVATVGKFPGWSMPLPRVPHAHILRG